jgi:hypothetical protein
LIDSMNLQTLPRRISFDVALFQRMTGKNVWFSAPKGPEHISPGQSGEAAPPWVGYGILS